MSGLVFGNAGDSLGVGSALFPNPMASAERRGGGGGWLTCLVGGDVAASTDSRSVLPFRDGNASVAAFGRDGSDGAAAAGRCGTEGEDFEGFNGPLAVVF